MMLFCDVNPIYGFFLAVPASSLPCPCVIFVARAEVLQGDPAFNTNVSQWCLGWDWVLCTKLKLVDSVICQITRYGQVQVHVALGRYQGYLHIRSAIGDAPFNCLSAMCHVN